MMGGRGLGGLAGTAVRRVRVRYAGGLIVLGALSGGLPGLTAAPLAAQRTPARIVATAGAPEDGRGALGSIEAEAREGRLDEARRQLLEWFDGVGSRGGAGSGGASDELQHALWLRALLTLDPVQAANDYRRLAVEFAGGAWADRALERLAWIAEVRGDLAGAAQRYETIARDYPGSDLAARARIWLEAHDEISVEPRSDEPRVAAGSGAGVPDKRAATSAGRSRTGSAAPAAMASAASAATAASTASAESPVASTRPPAPVRTTADSAPASVPASAAFTVQLGAFLNPARAMAVVDRLSRADHDARRVRMPGDQLVRVRVGRFVKRADAEALVAALRAAGFDAGIADDAARELPYR